MRIAIVTSVHPAFDKRIYERQARFLASHGMDVHVVAPGAPVGTSSDGIRLHAVPSKAGYVARFGVHAAIAEQVHRIAPDIVHFHDPDLLLRFGGWPRTGGPVIVYDAHEDFPLAARSSRGFPAGVARTISIGVDILERILARRVDGVVCAHRRRLSQLQLGPRGLYLPNYPLLETFSALPVTGARERSCLYLGELSPERGTEMLFASARLAPDVRWVIVGNIFPAKERERFLVRTAAEGLSNLEWAGVVPYAQVPAMLARAGVGVMPWQATPQHRWAAQPTKLYEYLAAGVPIVASRLEVTEEVVVGAGAGLLHDADDPEEMVACVRRILDDPQRSAAFSRAGREAYLTKFNYERLGPELLAFYKRLQDAGK